MSILKPRKPRQPLQAVNLGNLDQNDEEEDTTEVRRRRVSFARGVYIKEFNSDAELAVTCDTPAYEEQLTPSSDSSQIIKDLSGFQGKHPVCETLGESDMDISYVASENIQPIYSVSQKMNTSSNYIMPQGNYYSDCGQNKDAKITFDDKNKPLLIYNETSTNLFSKSHILTSVDKSIDTSTVPECSPRPQMASVFGPELINCSSVKSFNCDMDMATEILPTGKLLITSQSFCPDTIKVDSSLISDIQVCTSLMNDSSQKYSSHSNLPINVQNFDVAESPDRPSFFQSPAHKRYRLSNAHTNMDVTNVDKNALVKHGDMSLILSPPKTLSSMTTSFFLQQRLKNETNKSNYVDCSLNQIPVGLPPNSQILTDETPNIECFTSLAHFEDPKNPIVSQENCLQSGSKSISCDSKDELPMELNFENTNVTEKHDESFNPGNQTCLNSSTASNDFMNMSNLVAKVKSNFHLTEKANEFADNSADYESNDLNHVTNPQDSENLLITQRNILSPNESDKMSFISETLSINGAETKSLNTFNDNKRKLEEIKKDELINCDQYQHRVEQIFCDENIIVKRYQIPNNASYNNKQDSEQISNFYEQKERSADVISQRLSQVELSQPRNLDFEHKVIENEASFQGLADSNKDKLLKKPNEELEQGDIDPSFLHSKSSSNLIVQEKLAPTRPLESSSMDNQVTNFSSVSSARVSISKKISLAPSNRSSIFPVEIKNASKRISQTQMFDISNIEGDLKVYENCPQKISPSEDVKVSVDSHILESFYNSDGISKKISKRRSLMTDERKSLGKRISLAPSVLNQTECVESQTDLVKNIQISNDLLDCKDGLSDKHLHLGLSNYGAVEQYGVEELKQDGLVSRLHAVKAEAKLSSVEPSASDQKELPSTNFKITKQDPEEIGEKEDTLLNIMDANGNNAHDSSAMDLSNIVKTCQESHSILIIEQNRSKRQSVVERFSPEVDQVPLKDKVDKCCVQSVLKSDGDKLNDNTNSEISSVSMEVEKMSFDPLIDDEEFYELDDVRHKVEEADVYPLVNNTISLINHDDKLQSKAPENCINPIFNETKSFVNQYQDSLPNDENVDPLIDRIKSSVNPHIDETVVNQNCDSPLNNEENHVRPIVDETFNLSSYNEGTDVIPLAEESKLIADQDSDPPLSKEENQIHSLIKKTKPFDHQDSHLTQNNKDNVDPLIEESKPLAYQDFNSYPNNEENNTFSPTEGSKLFVNQDSDPSQKNKKEKLKSQINKRKSIVHQNDSPCIVPVSPPLNVFPDNSIPIVTNKSLPFPSTSNDQLYQEENSIDTYNFQKSCPQKENNIIMSDNNTGLLIQQATINTTINKDCNIKNDTSLYFEKVSDDIQPAMEVDLMPQNDRAQKEFPIKINYPNFVVNEQSDTSISLRETRYPGEVLSPLQLHNKHYMQSLGFVFCKWTEWRKTFFNNYVVIHINVPWTHFNSQTPILEISVTNSDHVHNAHKEIGKMSNYCASRIIKTLYDEEILNNFKTMGNAEEVSNHVLRVVDNIMPLHRSLEEVIKRRPVYINDGRLKFRFSSIISFVAVTVLIDLRNWKSLSRSDITMDQVVGKISLSTIKNVFFLSPKDKYRFIHFYHLVQKYIDQTKQDHQLW